MKNIIVIGSLHTDLIISGVSSKLNIGELGYADSLDISAGGKSRNIAEMIAHLVHDVNVSFIGKTVKDKFGFWKYPVEALQKSGVNTDFINILDPKTNNDLPGIAFIKVYESGENNIYLVPGIAGTFSKDDVYRSEKLFKNSSDSDILVLTFEMPTSAIDQAIKLAKKHNLKIFIDPGGMKCSEDEIEIIKRGGYLIKPNIQEAESITKVKVEDLDTAKKAVEKLHSFGFENILITDGKFGGYFSDGSETIKVNVFNKSYKDGNSVGCGDQTMAGIVYGLVNDYNIKMSVQIGIDAGGLQYTKKGVTPISSKELESIIN